MATKRNWLKYIAVVICFLGLQGVFMHRLSHRGAKRSGDALRCRCKSPLVYHNYRARIAPEYRDAVNCTVETAPITFMGPDDDWRSAEVKYAGRIPLCFVLGGLLDTGGVESWFWSLYETVFNQPPFYVYGVRLIGPRQGHPILRLAKDGVRHNPTEYEMVKRCSVIMQSGSRPLRKFATEHARLPPRILVIHGGAGDAWTEGYTQYVTHYDWIVSVSPNGLETVRKKAPGAWSAVIPAGVPRCKREPTAGGAGGALRREWGVPDGTKVLLYLGRIAPEKGLQYFVDVVRALPGHWRGVMVGPMVKDIIQDDWRGIRQLVIVPEAVHSADALRAADVLLNPSPAEGGPLVLLEAWAAKKPMFMRSTGWAAQYPDVVFPIKADDTPDATAQAVQEVARGLEQGDEKLEGVLTQGLRIFEEKFSLEVVAEKWAATLLDLLDKQQRLVERVEVPPEFSVPKHAYDETVGIQKCLYTDNGAFDPPIFTLPLSRHLHWPADRGACATLTVDYGVDFSALPRPGLMFVRWTQTESFAGRPLSPRHLLAPSANETVRAYHQRAFFTLQLPPQREVEALHLYVYLAPATHMCVESVTLGRVHEANCIEDGPAEDGGPDL